MSLTQEYFDELLYDQAFDEQERFEEDLACEYILESYDGSEGEMTTNRAKIILSYCETYETAIAACPDDISMVRWRAIVKHLY